MNKNTYLIFVLIVFVLGGNIDLHILLDVKVDAEFISKIANSVFSIEITLISATLWQKSKNDFSQK